VQPISASSAGEDRGSRIIIARPSSSFPALIRSCLSFCSCQRCHRRAGLNIPPPVPRGAIGRFSSISKLRPRDFLFGCQTGRSDASTGPVAPLHCVDLLVGAKKGRVPFHTSKHQHYTRRAKARTALKAIEHLQKAAGIKLSTQRRTVVIARLSIPKVLCKLVHIE
jgi:hypothetical protein